MHIRALGKWLREWGRLNLDTSGYTTKYNSANTQIQQCKYTNTQPTTSQIQGPLGNEFQDRPKYANKAEVQIINLKWSSMNHSSHDGSMNLSLRICWNVDIGSFCPSLMLVAMQNYELRGRFYSATECSATGSSAMPNYELVGMFALGQSCRRFCSSDKTAGWSIIPAYKYRALELMVTVTQWK